MAREPEPQPNALNQALEEFLSASAQQAPPAKLPSNAVRQGSPPEPVPSLRQTYDKVLADDAAKKVVRPEAPPTLWQRLRGPLVLVLVSAAAVSVWVGQPAWLTPREHASLRVPRTGVSARRQMAAIALEIEDYHRNTGRLPRSLTDLGLDIAHVRFTPLPNGRYELTVGNGPHTARYRGSMNGVDSMEAR